MPDAAWLALALLSALAGMAWLALAMDVHWRQVRINAVRSRGMATMLRSLGFLALAGSLLFCLLADTATMAVLVWMMLLAIAAVSVALVLSRLQRVPALLERE